MYELLFSSQQPLAKSFCKHCCNVMFLHIRQQMIDRVIKKKKAALALLNDELTEVDSRPQKLEFDNVALQAQRDVYESQLQKCQDRIQDLMQNRHVPKAEDRGLDTIVMIIEKNSTPEQDEFYEYPYYIARIQKTLCSYEEEVV